MWITWPKWCNIFGVTVSFDFFAWIISSLTLNKINYPGLYTHPQVHQSSMVQFIRMIIKIYFTHVMNIECWYFLCRLSLSSPNSKMMYSDYKSDGITEKVSECSVCKQWSSSTLMWYNIHASISTLNETCFFSFRSFGSLCVLVSVGREGTSVCLFVFTDNGCRWLSTHSLKRVLWNPFLEQTCHWWVSWCIIIFDTVVLDMSCYYFYHCEYL